MKLCTKCNNHKPLECFSKDKKRPDGLQLSCKDCQRLYYLKNQEKIKKYKDLNKNSKQQYDLTYRSANKEAIRLKDQIYYNNHKDAIKNRVMGWQAAQPKGGHYHIAKNLRDRLRKAVQKDQKNGSAIDNLGCSITDFKKHIESKFDNEMNWNNYGFSGWHIDHIKPLNTFDLTSPEEFKKACHYSNLQPLWAIDNLTKAKK